MSKNNVTKWMVDQLVKPEVQIEVIEYYEGVPMNSIRLAWPFKTDEERAVIQKFLKAKYKTERIKKLSVAEKAPF